MTEDIVMPLEHHPLHREFPELAGALQKLLSGDPAFARQAGEYEALDKQIYDIESDRTPTDDHTLQQLKMRRVALKDELEGKLREAL